MKKTGFTLIELLLAISGGMLILGILLSMYVSLYKVWDEYTFKKQINNNFMIIGERLAQQIISANCGYNEISLEGLPLQADIKLLPINLKGQTLAYVTATTTNPISQERYSFERYYRIRKK